MSDEAIEGVGRQLRLLRRGRSLTLAELAARAGCSDGYLSSVETGATVPTLSSLASLAAALGQDLTAFFPSSPRQRLHIHRGQDPGHIRIASSALETYTILSARSSEPAFTALLDEIAPSDDETSRGSYFGERFLLVLSGSISLRLGTSVHAVEPGQTLHYSSHPDHLLRVTSPEPALLLWIVTPALL